MLKVIMLSVDMLIVVMPSVVMMKFIMLSVVAPTKRHEPSTVPIKKSTVYSSN
jgi:hypothetical protein